MSNFQKENLPTIQDIQMGEKLPLFKIGLLAELKNHTYFPKENHLC
jgi:hypothetical protein